MVPAERESTREQARRLNEMINLLSLFTRRTMVEWLPKLESQMGITEQRFMVLWALNLESNISLKDLAQGLVVSPSSLSVMINAMVDQGYVTRTEDPNDRRRVLLGLTDHGAEDLAAAESYLENEFCRFIDGLDDSDRKDLTAATKDMLKVMKRIVMSAEE